MELKPIWTIYLHIHIVSGRRYVGLTKKTWRQRWNDHCHAAKFSKGGRWHFPNAIRKYGKEAFSHHILEVCDNVDLANFLEERWIELFETRDPRFGFNIAKGGAHIPHPKKNPMDRPEFRAKALTNLAKANSITTSERSVRTKKLWSDPEFRGKITASNRTIYTDPVVKNRAISAMKESFARSESVEKRSNSSKTMWKSEEFRVRNAELWQDPSFRDRCQIGLIHGSSLNKSKTHCPNEHEYSPENTYINTKGSRVCRTCDRENGKAYMRRMRKNKRLQTCISILLA